MRLALVLLALALAAPTASAQGFRLFNDRNHPHLDWRVAETENFQIAYPAHLEGIEVEAAAVAEASYAALSEALGVTFDRKVRIYLSDEDEIANGFAVNLGGRSFTNVWVHVNETAEIWTGEVPWLRKVLAHEIAHLFHYRATQSRVGLVQEIVSDPMPRFWTEGLAQYLTEDWDAQRGDRWLRVAAFENRLNYEDGLSPWNGRLLYAVGNSQVRYLAQTRGDSTITKILQHRRPFLPGAPVHDFYPAFRSVVGMGYREFEEEWRKHIGVYYNTLAGQMERTDSLGTALRIPGQFLQDVAYSPDTSRTAVLVLTSTDRPVRRLAVIEGLTDTTRTRNVGVLAEGDLAGPIAWHPEGDRLVYTRRLRGEHGSLLNDLFLVTLDGRTTRLTHSRRAMHPAFAPDGRLAFVGSEGGTANVFLLGEDGTETAVTAFPEGTHVVGLRWVSDSTLVASRFTLDGRRELVRLDAASGEATPLDDPALDHRDPVVSPDGRRVAVTSLRDDVPNVFVVDLATGAERRATHVFTGARVTDWLPPSEAHPDGRLLVVATETKRRERAFLIDAARDAEPLAPPAVPFEYAAWTVHTPPNPIPVFPDAVPITNRTGYNSWANLTHALTIPLPYAELDLSDFGLSGASLWLEPLGKHQLFAFGSVSFADPVDRTIAAILYENNQLKPTISLALYRYPDPARWYGTTLLVEDLAGVDLGVSWPLDLFTAPFVGTRADARLRYAYARPFNPEQFEDAEVAAGLPAPEAGTRAEMRLGFTAKRQRPYRFNDLAPMDGTGLRTRVTFGVPVLGAATEFIRPDVHAYTVSPLIGIGRFVVRGRAQAQFGRTLAQDAIGLSRFDDLDLQLPFVDPITLSDTERVRGYRSYALGNRVLFGTVEYQIPPLFDLRTRLLGFISLGRVSPALFVDAGMVWTDDNFSDAIRRTGVGFELKNRVSLAGFPLTHALGVAQRWNDLGERLDWDSVDVYYRLQAALPF